MWSYKAAPPPRPPGLSNTWLVRERERSPAKRSFLIFAVAPSRRKQHTQEVCLCLPSAPATTLVFPQNHALFT